jgi:hypothetical protein
MTRAGTQPTPSWRAAAATVDFAAAVMKTLIALPSLLIAITACGGRGASSTDASCSRRAEELKSYLIQVVDPTARPTPPWATGDPATDKLLAEAREAVREAMSSTLNPGDPMPRLSEGVRRGPVDDMLDGCPQARDAWANAGQVPGPDRMTKAVSAIADGVVACGCRIDIPLLRGAFYLYVRGPD